MSKKVALPLMLLSLGIFAVTQTAGCGSSSNGGGTGGKADGGTDVRGTGGATTVGTGGRVDSGTGTGGATGTGGRTDGGTDVAGTGGRVDSGTGTGGSDAATDAPADMGGNDVPVATDAGNDVPAIFDGSTAFDGAGDASGTTRAAVLCPHFPNNSTSAENGSMEPADFCAIFVQLCGTTVDAGDCIARYTASRYTRTNAGSYGYLGTCESAHVCNAYTMLGATDGGSLATHCPHAAGIALCLPAQ